MAASYYQYAERGADSQINWAEVGKSMVDMLNQEVQLREEKKAAIDEASRKFAEELANAPVGTLQAANDFALNYADDAQQLLLITDRLLKSGQLRPKDYMLIRQNMTRSTNEVFDIAENLQAIAKRKMEGMQSGEDSAINADVMASIEGLGKIDGIRAFFDPATGIATIADVVSGAKGVQQMGTKRFTTGQLRNLFDIDYKKYQLNAQTTETVKTLGNFDVLDWYQEATKGGEQDILTITSSISQNPNYNNWLDKQSEAAVVNPFDALSILSDWSGDEYTITFDENLAGTIDKQGKELIYIDRNTGIPDLTVAQQYQAEDVVRESLKAAVAREIETKIDRQPYAQPPSEAAIVRQRTDQANLDFIASVNRLRTTTGDEFEAVANDIISKSGGYISNIGTDTGKFTIYYSNGDSREFELDADTTGDNWVREATNALRNPQAGVINVDQYMSQLDLSGATNIADRSNISVGAIGVSFDASYENVALASMDPIVIFMEEQFKSGSLSEDSATENKVVADMNAAIAGIEGLNGLFRARPFTTTSFGRGFVIQSKQKDAQGNWVWKDDPSFNKFDLGDATKEQFDAIVRSLIAKGKQNARTAIYDTEEKRRAYAKQNPPAP